MESSRSLEAWQEFVQAVNKAGPFKTMKQCKDKRGNLEQAYKDAKTNKRMSDHKEEQRSLCSRWKSSRGTSTKRAEESRNFSFAWQNF